MRIHRGYAWASDRVLRAVVRFLDPRSPRRVRREAERELLAFPVEQYAPPAPHGPGRSRFGPVTGGSSSGCGTPMPSSIIAHFGGSLGDLPIRLSGRMRTRLGELAVELRTGRPHGDRHEPPAPRPSHDWSEVEHTVLHEMVHQWQAETGLRVDHGPTFRRKAREVGVLPAARRAVQAVLSQRQVG